MKICIPLIACFLTLVGCTPAYNEIGRQKAEESFEAKQKRQEELLRRQQEIIKRQENEKLDLERQQYYHDRYREFDPHE